MFHCKQLAAGRGVSHLTNHVSFALASTAECARSFSQSSSIYRIVCSFWCSLSLSLGLIMKALMMMPFLVILVLTVHCHVRSQTQYRGD